MYASVLGRLPLKASCTTLNAKYVHVSILYEKQEASYTVSNLTAQGAYSWLDYFQIAFLYHLISSNWTSPYKIFLSHSYSLTEVSEHFFSYLLVFVSKKKSHWWKLQQKWLASKTNTALYFLFFFIRVLSTLFKQKLQKKHLNSVWGCWAVRLGLWMNSPNSHFTIDRCYLWLFLFFAMKLSIM